MTLTKTLVRFATASLALGGLLSGGLTGSASAAATCVLGTPVVSPSTTVNVGLSSPRRTLTVKATNCTAVQAKAFHRYWVLQVGDGPLGAQPYPALKPTATSGTTTTFQAVMEVPTWFFNDWAGSFDTDIYAAPATLVKHAPSLLIRRASRFLHFNASPEPIKKGKTLTITAELERADWEKSKYVDYSYAVVELQFKQTNGSYIKIPATSVLPSAYSTTELRTGRGVAAGAVVTKVKATQDGCYRLVFKGSNSTAAVTTKGDCVNVT